MEDDFMKKIELPSGEKEYYINPKEENKEIKKLKDKIRAVEFKDEVNDNKFLDENDVGAYSKRSHLFWKIFACLCFISVLALIGFIIYLGYNGNLNNLISPNFNNTFNNEVFVDNKYENKFDNAIENTYNIQLNATINAPNLVCNSS